jgi:hypothetical protein
MCMVHMSHSRGRGRDGDNISDAPTAKFAPMTLLPSSGSKATCANAAKRLGHPHNAESARICHLVWFLSRRGWISNSAV